MASLVNDTINFLKFEAQNWWSSLTWTENSIPDLRGKTILVTGATDGTGRECARAFAQHGARVIIHGRNIEKAQRVIESIRAEGAKDAELEMMICDLTDFEAIKRACDDFKAKGWPIHVLLNNAGIQAPYGHLGQTTPGGFEVTMASNYFGPLYLTLQLLDVVKASSTPQQPARVVWVNSVGSQLVNPPYLGGNSWAPGIDWFMWPGLNWDDLKGERYPTSDWWQYSRTKLMDLMVAKEMARRFHGTGIEVFCAHPGLTRTDHFGKADVDEKWSSRYVERFANSFWGTEGKTGALPLMFACVEPRLNGRTGAYIGSPELGPVNYFQTGEIRRPNAPLARDPWACRRLLDASLVILREVDPQLEDNEWAAISPDGKVLLDSSFASKVLPADGTSGTTTTTNNPHSTNTTTTTTDRSPLGPKTGGFAIWHDAEGLVGRTAASIGRRPAPLLALCRRLLMSAPADV